MRIRNKKKFIIRTIETLIIPIFGLILILIIETIYEESEEKKGKSKHGKR